MPLRKCLFLISIILLPLKFFANPTDDSLSVEKHFKTVIKYFFEKNYYHGNTFKNDLDTSIVNLQHTLPALDLHYNYLSTAGSAADPMVFNYHHSINTFIGIHSYDLQMLESDDIRSYRTNKRYTELQYHSGVFKEQRIDVLHTQNITRNWNAGLIFDRQGVRDFMNFSNTFRSRFALFTNYNSPSNSYNLFAHAIYNTVKNGADGGLESDSLFDNTNVSNLGIKGLAYRISNAEEHERKRIFYVSQYLSLTNTKKDSLSENTGNGPAFRLNHRFSYERNSFIYKDNDPDSSFYSDFFIGSATYDSMHVDEIKNRLSIQVLSDTSSNQLFFRRWTSTLFAEHLHVNYGQRQDSSWNNISTGASFALNSDSVSPGFLLEGSYVVHGFDKGNYLINLVSDMNLFDLGRIGLNLCTGKSSPDLVYRWNDSNNFLWKNDFSKLKTLRFSLNYKLKKYNFSIEAGQTYIENYVYMNTAAFPVQYNSGFSVNQLSIHKTFLYRYWHFENDFVFQKTDRKGVIHIPSVVSDQSIYIENYYFKKALLAAIGLSMSYNSKYYANAFMPANALFYLQNETQTGGYMRFDLFINAQIKTARIFLKMENVADDLIKRSYYLVPHYPMPGRVLKFGLVWRFYD